MANALTADVTVDASGPKYALGNLQQDYMLSIEIRRHPQYTLFPYTTLFRSLISDADAVTDTFSIAVTFSEAMDPLTAPTLTFAPDVSSTLTFNGGERGGANA